MEETMSVNEMTALNQFNAELARLRMGNTVLMAIFLFIGIIGNSLVILIYFLRLRKSEDRYFIPFLAIFDLMSCISGTSASILQNEKMTTFPSGALCQFIYCASWFTSTSSACMLLVIAVQRYLKVCKPLGKQMDLNIKRIVLVIIFLFSGLLTFPSMVLIGELRKTTTYENTTIRIHICEYDGQQNTGKAIYSLIALSLSILNLIVTVSLYIPIGRAIYKRFVSLKRDGKVESGDFVADNDKIEIIGTAPTLNSASRESNESNQSDQIDTKQYVSPCQSNTPGESYGGPGVSTIRKKNKFRRNVRNNFTYMFLTIVIIYALSYIPTLFFIVFPLRNRIHFWLSLSEAELNIFLVLRRLYILNHIINPFIYGYFDLTFRREIYRLFEKKSWKRRAK